MNDLIFPLSINFSYISQTKFLFSSYLPSLSTIWQKVYAVAIECFRCWVVCTLMSLAVLSCYLIVYGIFYCFQTKELKKSSDSVEDLIHSTRQKPDTLPSSSKNSFVSRKDHLQKTHEVLSEKSRSINEKTEEGSTYRDLIAKIEAKTAYLKRRNIESENKKAILLETQEDNLLRCQKFNLLILSKDPLLIIFSKLNVRSQINLSRTSKHFHTFSKQKETQAFLLKEDSEMPLAEKINVTNFSNILVTQLNLSYEDITDKQLQQIFKVCPNIEQLTLNECEKLTDQALMPLPQKLKTLTLVNCQQLTGHFLSTLPQSLQSLNLPATGWLTDAQLQNLPTHLQLLNLNLNYDLTGAFTQYLPQALQFLNLRHCFQVNTVVDFFPLPLTLQSLNLEYTKLTDKHLDSLPTDLKRLKLQGCKERFIRLARAKYCGKKVVTPLRIMS